MSKFNKNDSRLTSFVTSFFNNTFFRSSMVVGIALLVVVSLTMAATTIGTNIITGGTLEAEGAYASTTGYLVIGTGLGDVDLSAGDLLVSGNATSSGWFNIGTTDIGGTIPDLFGAGDLFVGNNATVTGATTLSSTLDVTSTTTLGILATYIENATTTATVAMTYVKADSGKIIYIPGTGSVHTLPPATDNPGMVFKFIVGEAMTTNFVITADPVASIYGNLDVDSGILPCADEDVVTIVASVEIIGDFVTLRSYNDNWYVTGVGEVAGALTCT